jgi:hypothetical protein
MGTENHDTNSTVAAAFRQLSGVLRGLSIADCQDLSVSLLASVIVSHYRQAGMPLEFALECADAAIADVKENIRVNWDRA